MKPSIVTSGQRIFHCNEFQHEDWPQNKHCTTIKSLIFQPTKGLNLTTFKSEYAKGDAMLLDWYLIESINYHKFDMDELKNTVELEEDKLIVLSNYNVILDKLEGCDVHLVPNNYDRIARSYMSTPFCDLVKIPKVKSDWLKDWEVEIFDFNVVEHSSYLRIDSFNQFIHWLKILRRF